MAKITKKGRTVYPILMPTSYGNMGTINSFLLQDGDSLSLIDAGIHTEEYKQALIVTLAENGFLISDLSRILLTHHHEDHIGLVNWILQQKDIPVYAHPEAIPRLMVDSEFLTMRKNFFTELYIEMGCIDDAKPRLKKLQRTIEQQKEYAIQTTIRPLIEGDEILGMTVVETAGHSADSISFYDMERKWLFAGDVVLQTTATNAIVDPNVKGNRLHTVRQYKKSLERIQQLDIDLLFPGHQEIIEDHQTVIAQKLEKMHRKAERLYHVIEEGIERPKQIAQKLYRNKFNTEFSLVMSEVIGYLDYLEEKGHLLKTIQDGVWHYTVL
ncbi:MBL fold metallo-hydrolase [Viridibacillus sp. YIM B01967]|uniref:MBL fold metallo-hydrolase n=1 Tax=Viridibacillus soli TaxID=2798301 RepID=A0ABS1H2N3_9BACL|nr:MBL fold metallo-hydrolase [Viridibacillus soli]MBK3493663.1 MBL fold metallo-hydrolase [Viridibacillus soli]